MKQDQLLVEVKDLKTYFFLDEGTVRGWTAWISTSTAADHRRGGRERLRQEA